MDQTERLARISVILTGAFAVVAALRLGQDVLAPITLALVAGVVLSPLSDFWERHGDSPVWGALLGLLATLVLVGCLALTIQPVVASLVEQAPKVWSDMQEVVHAIRGLMRGLSEVKDSVASAIAPEANAANPPTAEESVTVPTVADAIMIAPAILSRILIFAGTLFFFLLTRAEIYDWVSLRLSGRGTRAQLALRLRLAERNVARYFLTVTLINAGLGVLTAVALGMIGVTAAPTWGFAAFLLNFVVYLGPAVFVVVLLFVGIAQFDGAHSLAPAAAFLTLNTLEGQFITPTLVGRHMAVNPLLVFLALIFGLWLWGPVGGVVAIPLLLWVLVLSDALTEGRKVAATDQPA